MIINGREIGPHRPPYIISEISCNHNGDFNKAMRLIDAAKDAGADAVKFQAYTPDTITLKTNNPDFIVKDGPWKGRNLWELYEQTHTPFSWFPDLFQYAYGIGITPFASVFDKSSVDMLERLECPAYKIASMEITDIPLIGYAAKTGKPIIISTGMASCEEIAAANCAVARNWAECAILHCVSNYPTQSADADLKQLGKHSRIFGLSDHTVGDSIPIAATALGACIIEKHLMLGDEDTEDFEFSMDPISFKAMVREVRNVWQAMQPPSGDPEQASRQMRRSLYVVADIAKGEPFTEENVRSIRPSYGLPPKELPWLLTKRAAIDLKRGTAMKREYVVD